MFFGREDELNFLRSRYETDKAQFIVIYGRRRVGKTELLRFFCKDKPHVFYVCRECTDGEQLRLFSKRLLDKSKLSSYIETFSSWEDAFKYIKDIPAPGKKLVVVDEFPYMVNGNKSIPSVIQNLWDEYLKDEEVMIILCGSSMSFMEKEILSEKNPLYGRTTGIYKVQEFDFFDSCSFYNDLPNNEKVLRYGILGGVPHYLNQFDHSLSTEDNIKKYILTKGSVLYNEVEFLMKQELRETATYYTIIEAIALGNTKLNDIYTKTGIDKTKINVYIKNLIDLNIVEKEYPVTYSIKKRANIQNGIYKLKDNYFKFFFRFMFPNLSELEAGDIEGVYEYNIKPLLNEYVSFVFEDVCIQYMRKLNIKRQLPFRYSKIGRWWDKNKEIDLIASDEKNSIIFGECKWKNSPVSIKELNLLRIKGENIENEFSNRYYYLFSKSGFEQSLKAVAAVDDTVRLVDINDICIL